MGKATKADSRGGATSQVPRGATCTIKKEVYELKMTTQNVRVEQRYGKHQKRESNRNPGNIKSL
jgi:hypothetical protein